MGCLGYEGRANEGGDCNDADANVHPGPPNGCDGVDSDCDGSVDEDRAVALGGVVVATWSGGKSVNDPADVAFNGGGHVTFSGTNPEVHCSFSTGACDPLK